MTTLKSATLALTLALAFTAAAASAAELKVAVFDAQQVLNGTNAAQRAVKDLTAKRDAAQVKIDALEKPLMAKQEKLREQQAVMAPDKFKAAQEDFAKDVATFRASAQTIQSGLDADNIKARKDVADAVRTAVEAIAKEKGYDLVVPKGMAFYNSPNVPDISTEALARANKLLDK
ncbi:MAG: hypothetical protein GC129_07435 [Proteobacteria bacterium]|nr:hypothetical protein [Pseudomonadota bacterium]